MQVGFIGLGTMGASMAANLQKTGYRLVVSDIRREAAERHLAGGAMWADTPRQIAEVCDVVFTSLPTPKDFQSVVEGESGLLAGLRPDAACFDLSTNSVALIRALHPLFAAKGAHLLDAPVSGGPQGAASGKLAIWVGGNRDVFDKHEVLLDAMGDQAAYIGPIGAGSIAKLVHNCASATINVVLAEVFTLGVKAGVEPLALWEAIRQGATGRQRAFDRMGKQFLTGSYDPPDFAQRLLHKDVSLAIALAQEVSVPMRLSSLALQEMTEALNRGWGARDSRVSMLLQQERSGIEPLAVDPARISAVLAKDGNRQA
jgi:3-hydroxyisobutyrate dehydrogenase-like beta-hydroxyacid dehydrogenase